MSSTFFKKNKKLNYLPLYIIYFFYTLYNILFLIYARAFIWVHKTFILKYFFYHVKKKIFYFIFLFCYIVKNIFFYFIFLYGHLFGRKKTFFYFFIRAFIWPKKTFIFFIKFYTFIWRKKTFIFFGSSTEIRTQI